jgi:chemotaxis protein methyltransferase CheR
MKNFKGIQTIRDRLNFNMTNIEFNKLSFFILKNYGIKLPISKKTMLEGRLQKRLTALNMGSFKEYCEYFFSPQGQQIELIQMIDVVTTNKTDFFREAVHFDFLSNNILPKYFKDEVATKQFKIWSAGCSTGEEPYTLAMVLSEFSERCPGFNFNILATDISSRALNAAATAVYCQQKVSTVPLAFKKKYLLKSRDQHKKTVRIVPELRTKVSFKRFNFIDGAIDPAQNFNVVFCRNVLIYFDRPTQEKVILKLCSGLETGGYLFLGHSESISNMNLPLVQIQPTTFKKI